MNFRKEGFKKVSTSDGSKVYRKVLDSDEAIQITIIDSYYFVDVFENKTSMIECIIENLIDNISNVSREEMINFLKSYI